MVYLNFKSEYNNNPIIEIKNNSLGVYANQNEIISELKNIKKGVLVFETYPGVDLEILKKDIIEKLNPDKIIFVEDYKKSYDDLNEMLAHHITDDRVFGVVSHHVINDFYKLDEIEKINKEINKTELTIVYGFGASLIDFDFIVPVSITRWEIQLRYRKGLNNFTALNHDEETLRKYKRGFFIEWRVADRIKQEIYLKANYIIDYNDLEKPMMIEKALYFETFKDVVKRPFRLVPYFDPGVWGGQWMKEVCNLNPEKVNYAWSFDGVFEENSVKYSYGDKVIEMPSQDIVFFEPETLLGSFVHARFGTNYPIRFDLLDTMEGGNLSLQVHPRTEYIIDKFGMPYTQDESYYLLDAKDDGVIYLGFKNDVDIEAFKRDMRLAEKGEIEFPAEKYVNTFKAKKHDHISIPAGTIHCSGRNTMVLEISAATYIFTFKLWDWGRLNLDGRPRPVHLEHGLKNLRYDYNYDFAVKELINPIKKIDKHSELTGLHYREFLKTTRFKFKKPYEIFTEENAMTGNLVEGKKIRIYAKNNEFPELIVNFAETFIIPAGIKSFMVESLDDSKENIIITAQVKNG